MVEPTTLMGRPMPDGTRQAYREFMLRMRESQETVLENWRRIIEDAVRKERSND
jgi:hypothetical protein